MSKFNEKKESKIENLAGGQAYKQSSKLAFISLLLTSFVKSQFYRDEKQSIEEVKNLFNSIPDKLFIAKCALYARLKFGMRSISHIVASLIAKNVKKESWTKKFFEKVIHRVDDITEILSYYLNEFKKPIPNSLKKGLKKAFEKFDEYQLAKYKAENKGIKLIDAVNLLRPKAIEKNGYILVEKNKYWKALSNKAKEKKKLKDINQLSSFVKISSLEALVLGFLKSFDTWESELVRAGQKAQNEEEKEELKKEVWIKLIKEKKLGYFALLRNLRNIFQQSPEILNEALELLTNENMIKKSLVLPFRFLTAIEEIEKLPGSQKILIALNKVVDISLNNVPKFEGETLVVLDCSGSMMGKPAQIGSLFSAILIKSNQSDFMIFSDNAKYISINPMDSTLSIANRIKFSSGGTNFHSIFQTASKKYNRIIILSDMQGWIGYNTPVNEFNEYKKKYNCNPFIYSFDLAGYGSLQFPENNIFCIAGFSEKIFDVMNLLEQDKNALINEIEKIVVDD